MDQERKTNLKENKERKKRKKKKRGGRTIGRAMAWC
jgi:hypothetical protein